MADHRCDRVGALAIGHESIGVPQLAWSTVGWVARSLLGPGRPGSKDSAPDDDASIVFGTDPFPDQVEILGLPEVDLHVLVDEKIGLARPALI